MLSRHFVCSNQCIAARWFTHSGIKREANQPQKNKKNANYDSVLGSRMYRVTDFDKRMLVWLKRYPSVAEVPDQISTESILKARNYGRIKATNYLIGFTILSCITAGIIGKRRAEKGENLHKMNDEWYQKQLEKDRK